ncbi:MAG: oligopeptide/dipeptide ABC transporter ATP-binding protein [Devosia sp.]
MQPLVDVSHLIKDYPLKSGLIAALTGRSRVAHAVSDISLAIKPGEIVGVVGESGSGKTTLGKVLVRLEQATDGQVSFAGRPLGPLRGEARRDFHRSVQMIFQDPYDTLNPRLTIFGNVELPLKYLRLAPNAASRHKKVMEALERVELHPAHAFAARYPHQLSGGQRQRVAIARALIVEPKFLVADEPVSMLDVSIRAGVLNLLKRLNAELGIAMMLITHDLTTAYYLSHRIAVMYLGKLVEVGDARTLITQPRHPYTQLLLESAPDLMRQVHDRLPLSAEVANATAPPRGCRFAPRCRLAVDLCRSSEPPLAPLEPDRDIACFRAAETAQAAPINNTGQ